MNNELDRRFLLGGLAGAAGISALAAMSKAGPLSPPAGAVASTGKTLSEVEPRTAVSAENTPGNASALYRISQPGSYYLTGNIQGVAGKHGIEIASPSVTLDLCGFTVRGAGPGSGDGIAGSGSALKGVSVLNGHVVGWGGSGVTFFAGASGLLVNSIFARENANAGIFAFAGAVISDCSVESNGGRGIEVNNYCLIERCTAFSNAIGIYAETGSIVTGCAAAYNTVDGIRAGSRNIITGNQCRNNGTGIRLVTANSSGANRVEENLVQLSTVCNYKVESIQNLLIRNTSAAAFGLHWDVAAANYVYIFTPAGTNAFTGIAGGVPFAAAGYDPNANFTIS